MPTNEEKNIAEIKEMLEQKKAISDRAEVQEEFLLKQLKETFDVNSVEEGEELIKQLTEEAEENKKENSKLFNDLIDRLEKDGIL
jgi:hypothetical protein